MRIPIYPEFKSSLELDFDKIVFFFNFCIFLIQNNSRTLPKKSPGVLTITKKANHSVKFIVFVSKFSDGKFSITGH